MKTWAYYRDAGIKRLGPWEAVRPDDGDEGGTCPTCGEKGFLSSAVVTDPNGREGVAFRCTLCDMAMLVSNAN